MRALVITAALWLLAACNSSSKSCKPGEDGCACREGTCDTGLMCQSNNTCAAAVSATLSVSDAAARGCEAVLTGQAGTSISTLRFADGVIGISVREAPRVALSFVSSADAPLPEGGVKLELTGPSTGVAISKVTCVDSKGSPLRDATMSIHQPR